MTLPIVLPSFVSPTLSPAAPRRRRRPDRRPTTSVGSRRQIRPTPGDPAPTRAPRPPLQPRRRPAPCPGRVARRPARRPVGPGGRRGPDTGIERWIGQRLSLVLGASDGRGDGICANVAWPSPAGLIDDALAAVSGVDGEEEPWRPALALWPLLDVVEERRAELPVLDATCASPTAAWPPSATSPSSSSATGCSARSSCARGRRAPARAGRRSCGARCASGSARRARPSGYPRRASGCARSPASSRCPSAWRCSG
jgi:hypothetical protein